jgi:DNA (cytosine-5)-methyltransferase 1
MTKQLTVGSLFAGVGGIELGLERLGMRAVFQVEKDEFAQKVLKKHWPDVPLYSDVKLVHGEQHCPFEGRGIFCGNCLPAVDVLCGGSPCQDISVAGKGAGLKEGTRSGLWFEYARLIRELRPRFVLVENVPALRSRGLDIVLRDLAQSGYSAEWDGIRASDVGALHKRDRIFIVAYSQRQQLRQQPGRSSGQDGAGQAFAAVDGAECSLAYTASQRRQRGEGDSQGGVGHGETPGRTKSDHGPGPEGARCGAGSLANANGTGLAPRSEQPPRQEFPSAERGGAQGYAGPSKSRLGGAVDGLSQGLDGPDGGAWGPGWEDGVPRVAHGVKNRVDRLRCLGNAVVPQVAYRAGLRIVELVTEGY